ncbi:hypothetical protein FKP32DRAFT_834160 [Trametes sanguinea]|nr:hypothetical protein FKP32DRAFT_834160 [Trametes sanguinea]
MRLTIAVVVAALSVYAAQASPFTASGQPMELTPGTFPLVPLDTTTSTPLNVTYPANGAELASRQVRQPATLVLCESTSCTGSNCFGYDLTHSAPYECLTPGISFSSAYIIPEIGTSAIPYSVYVGPGVVCHDLFELTRVNTCYHFEEFGAPFGSYVRTE